MTPEEIAEEIRSQYLNHGNYERVSDAIAEALKAYGLQQRREALYDENPEIKKELDEAYAKGRADERNKLADRLGDRGFSEYQEGRREALEEAAKVAEAGHVVMGPIIAKRILSLIPPQGKGE